MPQKWFYFHIILKLIEVVNSEFSSNTLRSTKNVEKKRRRNLIIYHEFIVVSVWLLSGYQESPEGHTISELLHLSTTNKGQRVDRGCRHTTLRCLSQTLCRKVDKIGVDRMKAYLEWGGKTHIYSVRFRHCHPSFSHVDLDVAYQSLECETSICVGLWAYLLELGPEEVWVAQLTVSFRYLCLICIWYKQ